MEVTDFCAAADYGWQVTWWSTTIGIPNVRQKRGMPCHFPARGQAATRSLSFTADLTSAPVVAPRDNLTSGCDFIIDGRADSCQHQPAHSVQHWNVVPPRRAGSTATPL